MVVHSLVLALQSDTDGSLTRSTLLPVVPTRWRSLYGLEKIMWDTRSLHNLRPDSRILTVVIPAHRLRRYSRIDKRREMYGRFHAFSSATPFSQAWMWKGLSLRSFQSLRSPVSSRRREPTENKRLRLLLTPYVIICSLGCTFTISHPSLRPSGSDQDGQVMGKWNRKEQSRMNGCHCKRNPRTWT